MTFNRRHLLAGAAVLTLWPCRVRAGATDQADAMLALLPDRAGAAKLGAQWIAQERTGPGQVLDSLQRKLRWSTDGDATTFRHNLADAITDDFRNGEVVKVEGWQLAKTQAELCALAYFAASGRV